jgi:hypothetical protein
MRLDENQAAVCIQDLVPLDLVRFNMIEAVA